MTTLLAYISELDSLFRTGHATEHSYRPALQLLLTSLLPNVRVTNEPKRIACGAPDYILTRGEIPVGYIEAKDVVVDIQHKSHKEQFDRYRKSLDNLIITDYLTFEFYRQSEKITSICIGRLENGGIVSNPEGFAQFEALVSNFAATVSQSIKSPTRLASLMAVKARLLANVIASALAEDEKQNQKSSLYAQMAGFRSILIHDIKPEEFADIYAQTIAYGLFAARYHDPSLPTFSRQEAATLIPKSNPFLRNLFQYIAGYDLDQRIVWIVEELITIFLATDVASIMRNFGRSTAQQDPVIHFYETFLAEYDPRLRKARGVWYTPQPVVGFIVRAVDDLLKSHFGLPEGLADTSQITIKVEAEPGKQLKNKKSVLLEKQVHKVQILDPATGTGTFLAQTIRHLHAGFANMPGLWSDYVDKHLIPRLNGFELLMASYAMAHLKLDMLLTETGYKPPANPQRLRVFLTNSLEEHHPDTGSLFASWLSSEANEANHVKRDTPVMVVMGNPPYSKHSANKGGWIKNLLSAYKQEPGGGKLLEKNPKWLNDDYVKFIRYGQHFVDRTGEGVLAFITNNGYLDNPTFRGMRWSLMQSFDEIYLLDLHGNSNYKETAPDGGKDENVFDIKQGVSIALMVKTGKKKAGALATIRHVDLFGKRQHKYDVLDAASFENLPWQTLIPSKPNCLWVPRSDALMDKYLLGFGIQELFPVNSVGIVTSRDGLVIDTDRGQLVNRIKTFFELDEATVKTQLGVGENSGWKIVAVQKATKYNEAFIKQIAYRPFDNRYFYSDPKMLERGREKVMSHMSNDNVALISARSNKSERPDHVFITSLVSEAKCGESTTQSAIFPLYVYSQKDALNTGRSPNFDAVLLERVVAATSLKFEAEATSKSHDTFTPSDLLDYIYAVLHSPSYREKYREFLKTDFPRVPYPSGATSFRRLAALGAELRLWHLLKHRDKDKGSVIYQGQGDNRVDKPHFEAGRVYINTHQYFDGVSEDVWSFYIGGYQPAQKWLKDRISRVLERADVQHYMRIVAALKATVGLMLEVDQVMAADKPKDDAK